MEDGDEMEKEIFGRAGELGKVVAGEVSEVGLGAGWECRGEEVGCSVIL